MRVWRISQHADLSGRGGIVAASRWNHAGTPIVYCSDHPSTAMLEILVNLDPEDLPETYQLLGIDIPNDLAFESVELPEGWKNDPKLTRNKWSEFSQSNRAAILSVPSAIMPFCRNFLINPQHPDHARVVIAIVTRHLLDPRFRS